MCEPAALRLFVRILCMTPRPSSAHREQGNTRPFKINRDHNAETSCAYIRPTRGKAEHKGVRAGESCGVLYKSRAVCMRNAATLNVIVQEGAPNAIARRSSPIVPQVSHRIALN